VGLVVGRSFFSLLSPSCFSRWQPAFISRLLSAVYVFPAHYIYFLAPTLLRYAAKKALARVSTITTRVLFWFSGVSYCAKSGKKKTAGCPFFFPHPTNQAHQETALLGVASRPATDFTHWTRWRETRGGREAYLLFTFISESARTYINASLHKSLCRCPCRLFFCSAYRHTKHPTNYTSDTGALANKESESMRVVVASMIAWFRSFF
jgi:hypothetical protein